MYHQSYQNPNRVYTLETSDTSVNVKNTNSIKFVNNITNNNHSLSVVLNFQLDAENPFYDISNDNTIPSSTGLDGSYAVIWEQGANANGITLFYDKTRNGGCICVYGTRAYGEAINLVLYDIDLSSFISDYHSIYLYIGTSDITESQNIKFIYNNSLEYNNDLNVSHNDTFIGDNHGAFGSFASQNNQTLSLGQIISDITAYHPQTDYKYSINPHIRGLTMQPGSQCVLYKNVDKTTDYISQTDTNAQNRVTIPSSLHNNGEMKLYCFRGYHTKLTDQEIVYLNQYGKRHGYNKSIM